MSTRFVNQDLASAVRDVVQIRNGSNEPQYLAGQQAPPPRPERRTPSPNTAAGAGAGVQPRAQPKAENPFENAEVETFTPSEPKEIRGKKSSSSKEKDRKGSRHADVIDTWDPTGLGSAMWHHSGPYDAAAPSRNLNTPAAKAPMYAFGTSAPQASQPAAVVAAPAPRVSPAGVPVPPPKDIAGGERRGSARPISGRASGGGLSGQYSTSVPSGSYFPEHQPVPEDGEDHPGRRRQTEKERALKAAWGIDTPEPYEDFGWSPREDAIDLSDPSFENGNPPRSPGFKNVFGAGAGRAPPLSDEILSPTDEGFANRDRGSFSRPGVKRTKSLMQKIKSMREKDGPGRSSSPGKYSSRAEPPVPPIPGDERRVSHATRGSVSNSASGSASASANATTLSSPARERPEVTFDLPTNGRHQTDEQEELNPEPLSPLRDPTNGADFSLSGARRGSAPAQTTNTHAFGPKQKGLPLPPVGPVMPDFNDLVTRRGSAVDTTEGTVKRRPSIAKRFKERVGK